MLDASRGLPEFEPAIWNAVAIQKLQQMQNVAVTLPADEGERGHHAAHQKLPAHGEGCDQDIAQFGDVRDNLLHLRGGHEQERPRLGGHAGDECTLTGKNAKLSVELAGTGGSDHPIVVGSVDNPGLSFENDEQSGDGVSNLDQNFIRMGVPCRAEPP